MPHLGGKAADDGGGDLREAGDDDHHVVGGVQPMEDGEADQHGHGGDEGAGGLVPRVLRHPPAEQTLHVGELEHALPDEGHHVHQHGEHHHHQVGAPMAWPWLEGDLETFHHVLGVDHVHQGQLLPLDQLGEVPETEEKQNPAGNHDPQAHREHKIVASKVIEPGTKRT